MAACLPAPPGAAPTPALRRAAGPAKRRLGPGARELVIIAVGLGLAGALRFGGMISDEIHATTPWLMMTCLALPMVVASAAFWAIGRLASRHVELS